MITITNLASSSSVSLYPDEIPEDIQRREVRMESVTGYVYNDIVKVRKAWNVKAYCEATERSTLLSLNGEDYLKATIDSVQHTVIMTSLKFTPLRKWGNFAYEVSLRLEERGW